MVNDMGHTRGSESSSDSLRLYIDEDVSAIHDEDDPSAKGI